MPFFPLNNRRTYRDIFIQTPTSCHQCKARPLYIYRQSDSEKNQQYVMGDETESKVKAAANFWQFVAKLFKNDLKEEYDANDKDRITELVINLVEAGQL